MYDEMRRGKEIRYLQGFGYGRVNFWIRDTDGL